MTTIAQLHHLEYEANPDVIVSAPGCIRFLGEHTIGTDGLMLAFPLSQRVSIAISGRRDSSIRFFAADINERKRTNLSNLRYKREDRWANYIKASVLSFLGETNGGKGLNITISGDILQGLGLGSATALQCAASKAAAISAGLDPSPIELAKSLVDISKSYFERTTKIADFLPILAAENGLITFVDAYRGTSESLPSVFKDKKLLLTDSRVPKPMLDTEIRQRSNDCSAGLTQMNGSATRKLRDYSIEELDEFMGLIPERVRRHCAFFVEEVQRVREAREAALHGDLALFARALNKSQAGLRNNYEISCPEIDWLVKRALELDYVLASRMIGKGFGGCTLTVLEDTAMDSYKTRLDEYERIFGFKPYTLEISVGAGIIVD